VTLAGVNPGELASTVMVPAALVDSTSAMHHAGKGFARTALIGFVAGRVAVANADRFPLAETRKLTSLSAIGSPGPARPAPRRRTSPRLHHRPKSLAGPP